MPTLLESLNSLLSQYNEVCDAKTPEQQAKRREILCQLASLAAAKGIPPEPFHAVSDWLTAGENWEKWEKSAAGIYEWRGIKEPVMVEYFVNGVAPLIAMRAAVDELRDAVSSAPPPAPPSNQRGPKPLSENQAAQRRQFYDAWLIAKDQQGLSFKQFRPTYKLPNNRTLSADTAETWRNYESNRRKKLRG